MPNVECGPTLWKPSASSVRQDAAVALMLLASENRLWLTTRAWGRAFWFIHARGIQCPQATHADAPGDRPGFAVHHP
jgi:hypothetical protein